MINSTTFTPSGSLRMAFASPIMLFRMPDAPKINATLIEEAYALRDNSSGVKRSNRQGWHSDTDLMTRPEAGFSTVAQFIKATMLEATRAISPDFDPNKFRAALEGWVNINPQHGYNVPHRHLGSQWSGTYYVTVPVEEGSESGSIEFLSPLTVPTEYKPLGASCFREKIVMRPEPGDLLIFPSYLMHWVVPNEIDEDRISIAFNGVYVPQ
jgi:uncharacterized protein (TIGR02466 family)